MLVCVLLSLESWGCSWERLVCGRSRRRERTFASSPQVSGSRRARSALFPYELVIKLYLERAEETLINAHHGTGIVKLSTVVGSAEESNKLALGEELVPIFHDLVGTADEVHVMLLQEA